MKSDDALMEFALKLKRYMKDNGISKYQIVRDTAISKPQLNRLLRGDSVETKKTLFPLMEYLRLKVKFENEN